MFRNGSKRSSVEIYNSPSQIFTEMNFILNVGYSSECCWTNPKKILLWHSNAHWVYVTPDHRGIFYGFVCYNSLYFRQKKTDLLIQETFYILFLCGEILLLGHFALHTIYCSSQNYKLYKINSTSCTQLYHIWCPIFTMNLVKVSMPCTVKTCLFKTNIYI